MSIHLSFRHLQKNTNYKSIFKIAFVVSSLFLIIGLTIYKNNGFPSRFPENKILMEAQKDSLWDYMVKQEQKIISHPDTVMTYTVLGNKSKIPQVMIWGDSHARSLVAGLDDIAKINNSSFFIAVVVIKFNFYLSQVSSFLDPTKRLPESCVLSVETMRLDSFLGSEVTVGQLEILLLKEMNRKSKELCPFNHKQTPSAVLKNISLI